MLQSMFLSHLLCKGHGRRYLSKIQEAKTKHLALQTRARNLELPFTDSSLDPVITGARILTVNKATMDHFLTQRQIHLDRFDSS